MDQDIRQLSNEMLLAILDKRIELESLNEAEMIDFIGEASKNSCSARRFGLRGADIFKRAMGRN
jgi:hypothetical protein